MTLGLLKDPTVPANPGFSDSAPRYLQMADLMRQRVLRGTWPVGDKLPSLDALVDEFGVARVTVRQAVDVLTREGIVSPQQGRGTFVMAMPKQPRKWLAVQSTLDELARHYRNDKPQIVSSEEIIAAAPLLPQDGTPAERYVFMRRVHSKDDQPYCVINLYLDERIFRKNAKRFRSETVIPILNAMGEGGVAHAHQVLTIGTADMEVARLLRVPVNTPVAEVRRVFTDAHGRVIYLGEVTYRGDFIQLQMTLK
jgi:GntR family transcriptional regulator